MPASLSVRLHELMTDIESCILRSSLQKVAGYLAQEDGVFGTGQYVIALGSGKQTLAAHLNLAPETLSRIFSQLSKEGVIEVHGRNIHVLEPTDSGSLRNSQPCQAGPAKRFASLPPLRYSRYGAQFIFVAAGAAPGRRGEVLKFATNS